MVKVRKGAACSESVIKVVNERRSVSRYVTGTGMKNNIVIRDNEGHSTAQVVGSKAEGYKLTISIGMLLPR